ncbi:AAA family ATPase [Vibrio sp. Vb0877]|jgi:DNA transposition AAA+ family ATPase|uniref:AAA family ATPase n=1 Tax=Vibrio sp. Vb0877 TaxID=2816073 RepID=UPI001A8D1668|nr:ATP-binding protein [Vibrio sp. Vb0877]EJG1589867.1 ATP-binding protein [Vibrio parahaemolyticus]MBO0211520.1 ATP-binding protein [Vibrio sp. Vb0877]HBC3428501.1 ATP-binding protein [Vibrio parahaemolyticus]
MKHKIIPVKNVARLASAYQALESRPLNTPGMGLVWGETGRGKTTATTWLINRCNGIYVRALALWNASSMLRAIAEELDLDTKGTRTALEVRVIEKLAETQRPLFVDEADHIVGNEQMMETLRDIHDLSTVPVIMVGMGQMRKKVARYAQLENRIMHWIEFAPCDREDAVTMAKGMCEVEVEEDLLHELIDMTRGEIRRLVVGLAQIEDEAKSRGLLKIGKSEFKRDFFLGQRPGSKGGR